MIVVSAVLVVAAFGLLIAGITLPLMVLVYVSIGVSVLAALLLGAGAFKRRGELFGADPDGDAVDAAEGEEPAAQERTSRQGAMAAATPAGVADASGGSYDVHGERYDSSPATAAAPGVPADAPVAVVPSRGTYHLGTCRQLRARESHELAHAEAREQGYVACSSCMPDTVLAARGSATAEEADDGDARVTAGAGPGVDDETDASVAEATPDVDEAVPAGYLEPAVGEARTSAADEASDESAEGDPETHAGLVGVVSGSHRYHRLTCAVVEDAVNDGIELTTMGRDEAEAAECTRCTVCRP